MKYILIILFFSLQNFTAFAQRDTISINNDWRFVTDKQAIGIRSGWFRQSLPNSRAVQLPHTWNIEPENENFYGWGWYQRMIRVPASWKNKNVVLQFGAINHTSNIYLNGILVHENVGDGFNKIFVNLNGKLRYGQPNIITVACNNDFGRIKVPYMDSFDWPNDGGLIRTVQFIVSGKPAANYIHAEPVLNADNHSGSLKIKLGLDKSDSKNLSLQVTVTEENQATKKIILRKVIQPVWENGEAAVTFGLSQINPWHFDFPNLYSINVTILKGRKAVDQLSTNVGFRRIKFIDGQTYLNGEAIKLMGVEWTSGSNPNFGFAETGAEIIRNAKLMKDVNAIFSRVHFQQDDVFYDFCDRNGILLQEEIPLWGAGTPSTEEVKTIAQAQLSKMVSNHFNHPSIMGWGVGNELNGRNPKMKTMIKELIADANRLDPGIMVSYVSNTLKNGFVNQPGFIADAGSFGDYLMMNEYAGSWWDIPEGKLPGYLDSIHLSYPSKPFFISEFGLCEPNFKGGDERRIKDLIYHMAVYETKPYVQGAIYFDLTDYRTHYPGTAEDNKYRRRIHGVYDMYGKPKPSMKILRELSSPVEVQGISARRGKLNVVIMGSIGLPQHIAKGYKLYLSDREDNFRVKSL